MTDLGLLASLCALALLIVAACHDLARFLIPDWPAIGVALSGLAHLLLAPGTPWLLHLAAPVVVMLFGLVAFGRGWLGGADIKLLAACALWSGLSGLPMLFAYVSLCGGLLALVLTAARRAMMRARPGLTSPAVLVEGAPLPYAVAILAGSLWWALGNPWP